MQAGAAGVGADAHLGPARHQPVERLAIGGAHVHGGEHAQGAAGIEVGAQLLLQQPQAAPPDEGAEQIDPIGGRALRLQSQANARLAGGIDQQGAIGQGDQGPGDGGLTGKERGGAQLLQQPGAGVEVVAGMNRGRRLLVEQGHDPVHQGQLLLLPLGFWEGRQGCFAELAQVAGQALGGFGGVERFEVMQRPRLGCEGLVSATLSGWS